MCVSPDHELTCTVRLLLDGLFKFSSYANKADWFQNVLKKTFFKQNIS